MRTIPDGLALPEGNRTGPNCGVTALAIMCGVSFDKVWTAFRLRNHNPRWKGRSTHDEREAAARCLGFKMDTVILRRSQRMTLRAFAMYHAKPGVAYLVRTTGHVQVVKDGWIIDQLGPKPASAHWGARKFVSHYSTVTTL